MVRPAEDPVAIVAPLIDACRIVSGAPLRLDDFDSRGPVPAGLHKAEAERLLGVGVKTLARLQERLYAHATWSLLVIVQAQDAGGKDGTIKHALSGVNPQGVTVTSFRAPSSDDLAHDFLWRINRALPARGMIGVFNRSHYEEVLVPRVHPDVLARERLPPALTGAQDFWEGRLADIAAFEHHLVREGTLVLKFFLNVSRAEQKKRLLDRLDEPDSLWKFDPSDLGERDHWDAYRSAYEAAIAATATPETPWYVIPADRKWLMRLMVQEAIIAAIRALDLEPVRPDPDRLALLDEARRRLEAEP